ncbi:hypothetical protein MKX01_015854 [Papaver californicum]|nr:hypothetical protein MKX01_015854 [Papaver californicum]
MPEILDLMETTLEQIFKNLDSKKEDLLQEHDKLPQGQKASQVDDDEAHEEYGCKTPDTLPQLPHTENGIRMNSVTSGPVFSLGLTQFFNEYATSGVTELEKPKRDPKMKGISEEKVSSLVRRLETRSSRVLKGVGEDFTPYGRTKPKEKPKEVSVKPKKYKKFDSLKLLLKYYMYKLDYKQKEPESQMQDTPLDIPDGVFELFIPIYTRSVSHWTLSTSTSMITVGNTKIAYIMKAQVMDERVVQK